MKIKRIMALVLACFMLAISVSAEDVELDAGAIFGETENVESLPESSADQSSTVTDGSNTTVPEENGQKDGKTTTETGDVVSEETTEETTGETTDSSQENLQNGENAVTFTDVPSDSKYADDIAKLVKNGIIDGYEDGSFRPENGITRAEMCKMINLTFNYVDYQNAAGFPDVAADEWYTPYVLAAQQAGYIEGYEDGTFRPNNNITRQEVCVIMERIIKPMDLGLSVNITDEVSDWAKKSVELIVMNMLMPLEENNTFRATENIKRYEHATMLSKFVVAPIIPLTAEVRFFDGETQIGETEVVMIGDVPTLPQAPVPKEEGYEFVGWRVVGETEITDPASIIVDKNVDYEAVFAIKKFNVDFYDGGTLFEKVVIEYGQTLTAPSNTPKADGYDFLGWSFSDGGDTVELEELTIVSDITLYAVYEKQESGGGGPGGGGTDDDEEKVYYDVYFFVEDELYNTQSILEGSYAKKPDDPEVEGAIFLGWSTKEDGDEDDVVTVTRYKINDYTDFYAVLKVNPNDPELIDMLERGIEELEALPVTAKIHKTARNAMVDCMKLVIDDAKKGIFIDQTYVSETYSAEVEYVETLVLDEMSGREASNFKSIIQKNVDKDVQEFLSEYFLNGEDIEV